MANPGCRDGNEIRKAGEWLGKFGKLASWLGGMVESWWKMWKLSVKWCGMEWICRVGGLQIELKDKKCARLPGHTEMLEISRSPEAKYFQVIAAHALKPSEANMWICWTWQKWWRLQPFLTLEVLLLSSQRHSSGINLQAPQHLPMTVQRKTHFVTNLWRSGFYIFFPIDGYGSIPINTIFSGMNIHKSQLFWCELQGYQGFDPHP